MAGVVTKPPMSAVKLLRKMEAAYTQKTAELDSALRTIQRLERRVHELETKAQSK